MTESVADNLAAALQSLITSLSGYKGCPSIQAMIEDARVIEALTQWAETKKRETEDPEP